MTFRGYARSPGLVSRGTGAACRIWPSTNPAAAAPAGGALTGIDIAFLPMNLSYTMSVEQAASAVAAFAPAVAYPYHYKPSDPAKFVRLVADAGDEARVVLGNWYAPA